MAGNEEEFNEQENHSKRGQQPSGSAGTSPAGSLSRGKLKPNRVQIQDSGFKVWSEFRGEKPALVLRTASGLRHRPLIYNLICVLAEKVGETLSALRLTTRNSNRARREHPGASSYHTLTGFQLAASSFQVLVLSCQQSRPAFNCQLCPLKQTFSGRWRAHRWLPLRFHLAMARISIQDSHYPSIRPGLHHTMR